MVRSLQSASSEDTRIRAFGAKQKNNSVWFLSVTPNPQLPSALRSFCCCRFSMRMYLSDVDDRNLENCFTPREAEVTE